MAHPSETRHPIGVVADRTGLTRDVLRVWERRYKVVSPKRSPGGQRVYSDSDIERLALLHRATSGGHSISHVASLSRNKLEDLVREIEVTPGLLAGLTPSGTSAPQLEQLIALTEAMDSAGLEGILRRSVARYGIIGFIDEIAAPFLREIGDAWHRGHVTVAQEHLASAVVQRVISETAPLFTSGDSNPAIVIATLEGERHAHGAMMAAVTAASEGWRVIYLGADLPSAEIAAAALRTRARAVGISVVLGEKKRAASLRSLRKELPDNVSIVVGGKGAKHLESSGSNDIVFVESMGEFHMKLAELIRK
jgi:DNA-binding transcriptional MerR regulator/methylmalonyl-CoA mutase cobalamin-binding subunit